MKPTKRYADLLNDKQIYTAYHHSDGKGIDYETRLRYVNYEGIQYWEHGAYDLLARGKGNPKGRSNMSHFLGTTCDKASDVSYNLFTPEGIKVKKSQLVDNPVLWRDLEHDMVVNASIYEPIKYASEMSPPIPKKGLKAAFPDPIAEKEKWPEIKKWIDWVNAQRNLGGELSNDTRRGYVADWDITRFVKNPEQPVGDLLYALWNDLFNLNPRIRKEFLKQTAIIREYPWLKTQGAGHV